MIRWWLSVLYVVGAILNGVTVGDAIGWAHGWWSGATWPVSAALMAADYYLKNHGGS